MSSGADEEVELQPCRICGAPRRIDSYCIATEACIADMEAALAEQRAWMEFKPPLSYDVHPVSSGADNPANDPPKTGQLMAAISASIDTASRARFAAMSRADLEAELLGWLRVAKTTEERGEAMDAWIGATGANPRKGAYGCIGDVVDELLDVAATALMAVEHFQGNDGSSTLPMLAQHIAGLAERIGVAAALDVVGTPAPPFTNDSLIATSAVGAGTLIYWANLLTLGPEEKTLRAMAADMRRIAAELPGTPAPTEHCDYCHRPLPHSYAEMRVCPAPTEPTP